MTYAKHTHIYNCVITRNLRVAIEAQPSAGEEKWGFVKSISADHTTVTMQDGRVLKTKPKSRWETREPYVPDLLEALQQSLTH